MFLLRLQVNRGAHHLRGLVFWVVLGSPVHLSRSELSTINIRESRMNMAIEFAPHYQSAKNEARVYCRRDLLLENERHHREEHIRKARHRRRQLNANACNHPQPSSHRSVRLASGYCLAICWIWNLVDSNAKQTRGLCQAPPPSCCPWEETDLGSFTCSSGWQMSASVKFFLFQHLGVRRCFMRLRSSFSFIQVIKNCLFQAASSLMIFTIMLKTAECRVIWHYN